MKKKDLKYSRCSNCGKFFINTKKNTSMFCSMECSTYYKSCIVCGKYFTSERNNNKIFCSSECGSNPKYQELKDQELYPDSPSNLLTETLDYPKEDLND